MRDIAERLFNQLSADIYARRGIGQEWAQIDDDVMTELKEKWLAMFIEALLEAAGAPLQK